MPKQSKITSTKAKGAGIIREEPDEYYCCRCERHFKKQRGNFPASQSALFIANNKYLPICNHCIDELFEHYREVLGDEEQAIERMCLKFDIYYNPEIYKMVSKASTTASRIRSYISKTNLKKYVGKTYDDTLDERNLFFNRVAPEDIEGDSNTDSEEMDSISKKTVEFWGYGFTPDMYRDLSRRYAVWTKDKIDIDVGEEAILKQICMLEATINRDLAAGKSVDKQQNTLNNLLGSANLKPVQKKEEENSETSVDNLPFGMGIKMCEKTRPIPKPDPDFEDVDGIIKYISVWFLGHLCKMLRIKNTYSRLYEEEIAKYRVDPPEADEEDEESIFNNIFESDGD